jgi:hypothetical protein
MVSSERAEWLHKMGAKEAQLRALREQRQEPERKDTTLGERDGGVAVPLIGGSLAGDAAPVPRGDLPVKPRGRPLNSMRDKTLKATEPWKKCDPPVSRPTWFRRKKK